MRERPGFNHTGVLVMAIIHLVAGIFSIIFGAVQIGVRSHLGYVGYGIWCGAIYCVPGALGITSWRFKNNGNIIALMVMCIITSIFAINMLGFSIASLIMDVGYNGWYTCFWCTRAVYAEVILIFLSLLVFVTSIVCSAFCCRAVCCGPSSQPTGVVIGYANSTQQVMYPGQQVMYPGQQVMYVPAQGMQPQYVTHGYGQAQLVTPTGAVAQQGYIYNQPQVMAAGQPHMVYSAPQQAVTPQPQERQAQASGETAPVYTSLEENTAKDGGFNYTQLQS